MTVELHMLPIKAGDATLLIDRSKGRPYSVLIDAGLAQDEVVAYLQKIGLYHLDLIVLSHPDLDHLQGLLSLLDNSLISLDQVWCFDLAFLKEFVLTGKLPQPKEGTHEVVYHWLLRTLEGMDKVLTTLGSRNVLTLQVSSGHRLNLGRLHIEVLYPWDGFYASLYSPVQLKKLLSKKWPADWVPPEWTRANAEDERVPHAQKITISQERDALDHLLEEFESSDLRNVPRPLAMPNIERKNELENIEEKADDTFPISAVGTLYNNLSIVIKIHVLGGINPPTLLFPGDLTDWSYLIARRFSDLSADIFKYPHHGSSGPGISRKALRHFGHQFPRCCPCGPWCHPECCEWHHEYWHMLEKRIATRDACRLFTEVVRPRHILIYPYPSQGLPEKGVFSSSMAKIHANRQKMDADSLADHTNHAVPHVLRVGKERHEIETMAAGANP